MPIYLDNSATTRVCDAAAAAMMQCMQAGYFNPSADGFFTAPGSIRR